MSGMHGGGGGRRGRVSGGDAVAQRAENAEAPRIPNLLGRIAGLFAPHRTALIVTVVLVFISAGLSVVPPLLVQRAFDEGLFPPGGAPDVRRLAVLVGLMIAIYLGSQLLGVWQTWLTATVGNSVMGSLRVRLFTHLQAMELSFFTRTKTGVIQSRLQNDVGGVASVLTNTISSLLGNVVTVIASLVAMLLLSWQLAIVAVVLMPILVIAQRRVGQVRARIAAKTQESLSDMTAITQETLSVSGILLSKSFTRQPTEIRRYSDENDNQVRLQVSQQMSGQWFFAMVSIFLSSIPAIVYLFAGLLMAGGTTDITPGTIVAFTTVQSRLLFPLLGLMRVTLDLQTSSALFARIFQYLDLKPAISDAAEAAEVPTSGTDVGRVEFDNVTFAYPDSSPDSRPTLDHVSFAIEPGQFAAFVGPSGAGKTTVSYLIPRFYEASAGRVLFSGVDVRALRQESLVSHIGIVSQETYLFHATIAENLRYAKPDATDAELEAAARSASIHGTIASFPEGYATVVGERGYRLSGGEKQRIAIARVLLKNPEVLILDEATSALDAISERVVQAALDTASRGRTTIAIAHRLSTIVAADVIFVVDAGRIVESGTHSELLAANGVYARLYSEQSTSSSPLLAE
ncbi:ABC transporter ATP-binding protein [Cryobacterium sp. TMT2-10]|uniref:ABC transporter ATP-binding protein n=1 Tax=Cryobacterium shii TaxID=1259235 RepID=A0AAQ2C4T8_9MICO|nr:MULTISPECIES: ABC transporter ATP-binding protein [Cryobacterium]TFC43167.1 ABC transporter ATP-binding protein [Cryobacterium shii]TFC86230.1 ABC transporter ATP-binding protein [Cryobacterium sp. TmT2-59]TFD17399.1 ABC transporter ATP-binding protein [Cryobacterium sp. TMT4-10]TFD20812.1 ABC transporter ATP-binding protein [Cryobacterium sp. TMT2-23]TFD41154.1 ABC transporter ATP-binding protein [Cryobacterium sp. TMT2-10]